MRIAPPRIGLTLATVLTATLVACVTNLVVNVAIDGGDRTLVVGDLVTVTATVTTTGTASLAVTWTSDDHAVATIDANGQLTAHAEGTADITATSVIDPAQTDTITLTVTPRTGITSVTIDGGDRTLVIGDVVALTATVVTTGTADDAVTWSSDDDAVATVDAAGVATAHGEGVARITAASTFDATKADTISVTVGPVGALHWTRQFGTASMELVASVATHADGRLIVAGATQGALDGALAGGYDAFVRAFDADGATAWTRQFGTGGDDAATGIAVDADGHVVVTGTTLGDLDGGNAGGVDAFVRVYDRQGAHLWTRQFGTPGADRAVDVAVDTAGNVYVVGHTSDALAGPNAGIVDVLVRAYDVGGDPIWTRQFGTTGIEEARSIAVGTDGTIVVSGVTFGDLAGASAGGFDAFVRAFDRDGDPVWTVQFGTAGYDEVAGVAVDRAGRVVLAGYTGGDLAGPNAGGYDAFVRALDPGGTVLWTRQFGTSTSDYAYDVAIGANGAIYGAGATFGDLAGAGAGGGDAYVRAHDGDGNALWTRQFGTGESDYVIRVASDAVGGVLAVGNTSGDLEGLNAGASDGFVRRYGR